MSVCKALCVTVRIWTNARLRTGWWWAKAVSTLFDHSDTSEVESQQRCDTMLQDKKIKVQCYREDGAPHWR